MKNKRILTFLFLVSSVLVNVANDPLATISIRNFDHFKASVGRLIALANPEAAADFDSRLLQEIGVKDLSGIDTDRAWHAGIWYTGIGAPTVVGLYIPVSDFGTFQSSLVDGGGLKGVKNQNEIFQSGPFAVVVPRQGAQKALGDAEQASLSQWTPEPDDASQGIVRIQVKPDEAIRTQVLSLTMLGRMSMIQGMAGADSGAVVGAYNQKAMMEMLGVYLDVFETFIRGLSVLKLDFDADDEFLKINKNITATPDSELRRWLTSPNADLNPLMAYLKSDAPMSFAGGFGDNTELIPLIKKITLLSFSLQNISPDDALKKDVEELISQLFPMSYAGSIDLAPGFSWSAAYAFPKADLKGVQDRIRGFMEQTIQMQVGEKKPYKQGGLTRNQRKVGEVDVDRISLEFNLDSPLYQDPAQKEIVKKMWVDGKMIMDFGIQGNRMIMGSPQRFEELLKLGEGNTKTVSTKLVPNLNTLLWGRMDPFALFRWGASMNPFLTTTAGPLLDGLKGKKADVLMKIDVNESFNGDFWIPLSAISSFRSVQ
ncbi:MAG TPA: hypothetical protein EYQ50_07455 [Verrucomicrobiales bacterium]|nr:hypothetical protein [Verrucomicrobiales bacterium]